MPASVTPLLTVPLGGRGVPDVDVPAADADVAVGEVEDAAGRPGADHLPALRVGAAVGAADVEDPAVGRGGDAVRLAGVRHVAGRAVDQALAAVVGGDGGLAAGADHAGAPLDRAEQVGAEVGLVVARRGPAHAGVEGAAALEVAAPRDRPVGAADVGAVAGGGVRGAVAGDRVDLAGGPGLPLVPDVRAGPLERERPGCGVDAVADLDDLLGRAGRAARGGTGADQVAVEGAARLALGGAADADEAAAVVDVALEGVLLRGVERVAGVAEEDDGAVAVEVGGREVGRVLARVDVEVVRGAERLDGGHAGIDRGVRRPMEDEDPGCGRLSARARRGEQAEYRRHDDECRQSPDLTHRFPLPISPYSRTAGGKLSPPPGVCQRSFDMSDAKDPP